MRKTNAKEIKITKAMITKITGQDVSKSQKMKEMFELGMGIKDIAEAMEVRYNFAYNVISNYVNVNEIEVTKKSRSEKKDSIIALFEAGKTNTEISRELKTNINYVYKVLKEFKAESIPTEAVK